MARSLKFRIKKEEELYYPCSEKKCADQLRSYCTADLRLCFRIGKNLVSHDEAHIILLRLGKKTVPAACRGVRLVMLSCTKIVAPCNSKVSTHSV